MAIWHARRLEEAKQCIDKINLSQIKNDEQREKLFINKIRIMRLEGLDEEINKEACEFVGNNPKYVGVYVKLYCEYFFSDKQEKAELYRTRAIELDPAIEARLNRAIKKIRKKKGKTSEIKKDDITMKPGYRVYSQAGYFARQGDRARVEKCFEILDEKFTGHGFERPIVKTPKEISPVKTTVIPIIKLTEQDLEGLEDAYVVVKNLHISPQSTQYEEARKKLEKIIQALPDNYFALMGLLWIATRENALKTQHNLIGKLLSEYPDDPEVYLLAAFASIAGSRVMSNAGLKDKIIKIKKAIEYLHKREEILMGGKIEPDAEIKKRVAQIAKILDRFKNKEGTENEIQISNDSEEITTLLDEEMQAWELIAQRNFKEAKTIVMKLINHGIKDHTIFVLRFMIAIHERKIDVVLEMYEKMKWNLPRYIKKEYGKKLHGIKNALKAMGGGHGEIKANKIWEDLGARDPADWLAASVTGLKKPT